MKSKKLLATAMLLGGIAMGSAQIVQSGTETGLGTENGAYQNTTTSTVFVGYQAGRNTTGSGNTVVGHQAAGTLLTTGTGVNNSFFGISSGFKNTSGSSNVFVGASAGTSNTSGTSNIFIGSASGSQNANGLENVIVGTNAGSTNVSGGYNLFLGNNSGQKSTSSSNVFLGHNSGINVQTGWGNTFVGMGSGGNINNGDLNVFLGNGAGPSTSTPVSNKLYIANGSGNPTIYGDFTTKKVAIGDYTPLATSDGFPTTAGSVNVTGYRLFVKGGILTEEVRVALSASGGWADYVFNKDYKLPTLAEVEKYIADNGHLPNVPSAKQVKEDGIELGQMANIQQEKIEELTLYIIQQQKEIDELKAALKVLMNK